MNNVLQYITLNTTVDKPVEVNRSDVIRSRDPK